MSPELSSRLENVTDLPTPPAVAAHVINLAQQPQISMSDVAEAVTCDASLTTKILRVANSPMYAQRRQCTNLHQALVVLGINATVTLALGFSLLPMLRRSPAQNKHLAYTWRRCLLSAVAARVLADKLDKINPEEAFLAALLQDIGILAIDRIEPEFYADSEEFYSDHEKLWSYEQVHLGADHAEVGAWLLAHWNMPDYLQEAVMASHTLDHESAVFETHSLSGCVALSGQVADLWLRDWDGDTGFSQVADVAQATLGLDREGFALAMAEIGSSIPEMADMFKTEIIAEKDAQLIVERAQEALTVRYLQSIQEVKKLDRKTRELSSLASDLQEEAQRDALTRVASRGHLDQLLAKGFAHAKRFGWTLSIAFLDLDHFKNINDTYGHQVGDAVLRNVASLLATEIRSSDTVGRYGGEEFVLILPGADQSGVRIAGNRVLAALRALRHDVGDGESIVVTASMGCATLTKGSRFNSVQELVGAADKAVYAAKHHGRDCLIRYGNDLAPGLAKMA